MPFIFRYLKKKKKHVVHIFIIRPIQILKKFRHIKISDKKNKHYLIKSLTNNIAIL